MKNFENIMVSACLLGLNCRYDGGHNKLDEIEELKHDYNLIPVCPEIYGGMSTPRPPAEIVKHKVMNKAGEDVTSFFEKGAQETLKLAKLMDCKTALLKERSPSCGFGTIYDGNFNGTLVAGSGITARLLKENGISVFVESEIEKLLK